MILGRLNEGTIFINANSAFKSKGEAKIFAIFVACCRNEFVERRVNSDVVDFRRNRIQVVLSEIQVRNPLTRRIGVYTAIFQLGIDCGFPLSPIIGLLYKVFRHTGNTGTGRC